MQNYRKSDYAINKNSPNIVYRFHNEIIEITLEDYLKENPDKTEHDFAELKALSDQIYYEQDRAESAQTRKDVSIHGLEETEHCATRALDEEWEERVVDIQNRKYAWKALEQLFTVGALTEVQKRRFRLHVYFDQYGFSRFVDRYVPADQMDIRKSCVALADDLYRFFVGRYRLSGEWNIADCAAIDIHLDVETNVFQYALFRDAAHEASRTGVIDHAPRAAEAEDGGDDRNLPVQV